MDKEILARSLFGSSLAIHQALTAALPGSAIGLLVLAIFTRRRPGEGHHGLFSLFVKLYTIQFCIATFSGIVLDLQLGENWSAAEHVLGPLINHPFGRIALVSFFGTAFLLFFLLREPVLPLGLSIFIVLVLFIFSICFSAWTLIVNAWMHTPAGTVFTNTPAGLSVHIVSLRNFILNASCIPKLAHLYTGGLIAGFAFYCTVLARVGQKEVRAQGASTLIRTYLGLIFVCLFLQPILGHIQFDIIAQYQPAKASAIEGYYSSSEPPHYYLMATTDETLTITLGIHLPAFIEQKMNASFTPLRPLNSFKSEDKPNVAVVFYCFRAMLLGWVVLLGLWAWSCVLVRRGNYRRVFTLSIGSYILVQLVSIIGGVVSEAGRQPWIVYNILQTRDGISMSGHIHPLVYFLNFIYPLVLVIFSFKLQQAELKRFLRGANHSLPSFILS